MASTAKMVEEGFVTVREAAQFLAISRNHLYLLIRGGVISHSKHGGRIVVPRFAMKQYAKERLVLGSVA